MSPRHFHKMMSPQFFNDPRSNHNKRYAEQEEKIANFFKKILNKLLRK